MSALLLTAIALLLLVLGYLFYSPLVVRWVGFDSSKKTPAEEINDGVDFVPAKHWVVLFGHHFASIAGAAPIIGPVIACLFWGWLPAVIWIVVGGILFGAVHDFIALTLSLQYKGQSITSVTEAVLGRSGKILFSLFAFLALILVVAVFAASAGKTLATTPQVVLPTFGLILIAVIVGYLMYNIRLSIILCSIIGLAMLAGLIIAGYYYPVSLPVKDPARWWTVILLIYGLIASVTPVTLLLQPRDHLASGVLFVGMVCGFLGLIVTNPTMQAPAFISFSTAKGWLWPMLFVTIACGAISGFHSLVSSGTTSKQLPKMDDARPVGYGAMLMESALSILAIIAVSAGLYWKSAPGGETGLVYQEVFSNGGWIKAFGTGYGQITKALLGTFGSLVGITMLKTFIMTTLDSATRITRYLCNELFGDTFGIPIMKNKYAATLVIGILAGSLALGNWKAIWPIFGSSNQLIASLVLIVASLFLLKRGRNYLFTALPACIMLITTMGAMIYKTYTFLTAEQPKILLACVAIILMVMAVFLSVQSIIAVRNIKQSSPSGASPENG